MLTCPNCQTENLPEHSFCKRCGTALHATPEGLLLTGMLPPNTTLQNRYIITHRIGRGGMGAVYASIDARISGKRWAVKEMSDAAITNELEKENAIAAFRQEAEMLARLSHPNLPAVTDFFSEDGKQYLVMELVQGQSLQALLGSRSAPFPEELVVDWARQLCDVLQYLHSRQPPIIFRDLKPSNIMLEDTGLIKLIDFGIARLFKPGRSRDTQAMGTPGYAAPEQYGRGQTDARSDIYSLGVTLHNLLTLHDPGQTPFNLPPVRELNPAVSAGLEAVISRATRTSPLERYNDIGEMRQALTAPVPADIASTARELEPKAVETQPAPPRRGLPMWVYAAGGLLAVLLCVVLAVGAAAVGANLTGAGGLLGLGLAASATQTPTEELENTPDVAVVEEPETPEPLETEPVREEEPATATLAPPPTDTSPPSSPTPLPITQLTLGRSAGGADLVGYEVGAGPRSLVIVGGLHAGFAPSTVTVVDQLLEHLQANPAELPASLRLYLFPNVNPDSAFAPGERDGRLNAHGVDLNRNWGCKWAETALWRNEEISGGTAPFSEPETRALRDFILDVDPELVIFYEARAVNGLVAAGQCTGTYAPAAAFAQTYAAATDYELDSFELNGDSSDYLVSQSIPSISVLLKQYDQFSNADWLVNLSGLRAILDDIR